MDWFRSNGQASILHAHIPLRLLLIFSVLFSSIEPHFSQRTSDSPATGLFQCDALAADLQWPFLQSFFPRFNARLRRQSLSTTGSYPKKNHNASFGSDPSSGLRLWHEKTLISLRPHVNRSTLRSRIKYFPRLEIGFLLAYPLLFEVYFLALNAGDMKMALLLAAVPITPVVIPLGAMYLYYVVIHWFFFGAYAERQYTAIRDIWKPTDVDAKKILDEIYGHFDFWNSPMDDRIRESLKEGHRGSVYRESSKALEEPTVPTIFIEQQFLATLGISSKQLDAWEHDHTWGRHVIPRHVLNDSFLGVALRDYTINDLHPDAPIDAEIVIAAGSPVAVDFIQRRLLFRVLLHPHHPDGMKGLIGIERMIVRTFSMEEFRNLSEDIGKKLILKMPNFPGTLPLDHPWMSSIVLHMFYVYVEHRLPSISRYLVVGEGASALAEGLFSNGATHVTIASRHSFNWLQAEELRRRWKLIFSPPVHYVEALRTVGRLLSPVQDESFDELIYLGAQFVDGDFLDGEPSLSQDPDGRELRELFRQLDQEREHTLAPEGHLVLIYNNEDWINKVARLYRWTIEKTYSFPGLPGVQAFDLTRVRYDQTDDGHVTKPNDPLFRSSPSDLALCYSA